MLLDTIIKPLDTQKFQDKVLGKNCQVCEYLEENLTIITNSDNTSFFIDKRRTNKIVTSLCYDKIILDYTNHNIIYCEKDNQINIYLRNKESFIGKVTKNNKNDTLKLLSMVEGTYYFSLGNFQEFNNTLVSVNKKRTMLLTDNKYIIKPIFNPTSKLFVLYEPNNLNLIKIDESEQIKFLEKNLLYPEYISPNREILGFKNGLISELYNGRIKKITGINYTEMGSGLYFIKKGEEEALWYAPFGYILEPNENSKILYSCEGIKVFADEKVFICASMNRKTKETKLVKLVHNDKEIKVTNLGTFYNGIFLPGNLIVLQRKENEHIITYFYNNLGNKILTIPHSVRTTFIKKEGYRDYNVYRIDGEYYIYKGYKLNKIPLKITDMYISGIQTEIGDIAINEYDEKEFSKWIDYFRNDNNLKEIGDILLKLYNKKIEKEYPNLVRRLK